MLIISCLYSRKNRIKGLPSLLIVEKEEGSDECFHFIWLKLDFRVFGNFCEFVVADEIFLVEMEQSAGLA
jgi:hypothetical protein